MTIGQRGGRYTEADDSNMQIEQVGHEFFLDKWVGDGWKNISVHKSYDDALKAREELRDNEGAEMNKLFCDLKTDEEKAAFFLSGCGYETGVIAHSIQNDVAMAYHRCAEYQKELKALQAENEVLRAEVERDEALLREALYALEYASDMTKPEDLRGCGCPICTNIAALRERLGEGESNEG